MEEKRYYDTNEVAELFGVEAPTLRYWEKNFPQLRPKRDGRNRRRYTEADLKVIRQIVYQKEVQGRTNSGTRNQLSQRETAEKLILRLQRVRGFLVEIGDLLQD